MRQKDIWPMVIWGVSSVAALLLYATVPDKDAMGAGRVIAIAVLGITAGLAFCVMALQNARRLLDAKRPVKKGERRKPTLAFRVIPFGGTAVTIVVVGAIWSEVKAHGVNPMILVIAGLSAWLLCMTVWYIAGKALRFF